MMVMSGLGIGFDVDREVEPISFNRIKLCEDYAERYRQFEIACLMQCLGEESKPIGNEQSRYPPIEIEELLHPNSPFSKHFDFNDLDRFRLMCADCIRASHPYAIVIDKAVKLPRCARCGGHSTIYDFLGLMDNVYQGRYGGEQEAELGTVREGPKLLGGSTGAKMPETQREDRLANLTSAGVGLFHIEDHIDASTQVQSLVTRLVHCYE